MDWLGIRPPGLAEFSCIGRGMVTLFVLETLVKQSHTEARGEGETRGEYTITYFDKAAIKTAKSFA